MVRRPGSKQHQHKWACPLVRSRVAVVCVWWRPRPVPAPGYRSDIGWARGFFGILSQISIIDVENMHASSVATLALTSRTTCSSGKGRLPRSRRERLNASRHLPHRRRARGGSKEHGPTWKIMKVQPGVLHVSRVWPSSYGSARRQSGHSGTLFQPQWSRSGHVHGAPRTLFTRRLMQDMCTFVLHCLHSHSFCSQTVNLPAIDVRQIWQRCASAWLP